jgi:uncharacterized protein YbcV (DUF1398 family)
MPAGKTTLVELESLRSLWRGNCWHPTSAEPRQERFLPSSQAATNYLSAAYEGTLDFPAIASGLISAGFEGYTVDYRRGTATYFEPSGESIELPLPASTTQVAERFDASAVERAVREAQSRASGYTYVGFCAKVKAAGCAGYLVSFLGKRVLYFGRTAETHLELFPR